MRFFDLRYAALDTGTGGSGKGGGGQGTRLVFWHKMALLSEVATVEDVLFGFYSWLEGRGAGEVVMVSLQYEVSFFSLLFIFFLPFFLSFAHFHALVLGFIWGGYNWFGSYVNKRGHHHRPLQIPPLPLPSLTD